VLATQEGPGGGGYVLGFRIDPIEKLQSVCQELTALHKAFTREPDFGVEVNFASPEALQADENVLEPSVNIYILKSKALFSLILLWLGERRASA
jgi:hypothetical protein